MKKIFTFLFVIMAIFCGAQSKTLVITEVYGGGGNVNSSYKNDYVQLFNLSSSPIDLDGYTLQVAPASGSLWETISLSGIVPANHWYLIKGKGDGSYGADLPASDASGTFNINTESGKIALVNSRKPLATTCVPFDETIVDFIGYGNNVDCSETAAAPSHAVNTATSRINFAADGNNNFTDFTVFPPNPRNSLEIALPITLNVFSVNKSSNKANVIHWQVNCLSTSVTFEIERSSTLQNFKPIYSSTETKARCATPFDFKDKNPQNGENYYRLKIIDIDGNISYSKISLSINSSQESGARVVPNIVSSVGELHYYSIKPGRILIVVSNVQGKVVDKLTFDAVTGDNKFAIQVGKLSTGQYQAVVFADGKKAATAKFIKQ